MVTQLFSISFYYLEKFITLFACGLDFWQYFFLKLIDEFKKKIIEFTRSCFL